MNAYERQIMNRVEMACQRIAPLWPLKNVVAVNPYMGLSQESFWQAHNTLQRMTGNRLTVLMLLLVAFVGMVVMRFSQTYLQGDPREGPFHRWLSFVLGSFLMLIASGNTWEFWILWVAASLGLHQLVMFYPERPIAVLAARKKYLLHRVSDLSLLVALVLMVRTLDTSQLVSIARTLEGIHGLLPEPLGLASGLLVVSAVLKSAQFPFH